MVAMRVSSRNQNGTRDKLCRAACGGRHRRRAVSAWTSSSLGRRP